MYESIFIYKQSNGQYMHIQTVRQSVSQLFIHMLYVELLVLTVHIHAPHMTLKNNSKYFKYILIYTTIY